MGLKVDCLVFSVLHSADGGRSASGGWRTWDFHIFSMWTDVMPAWSSPSFFTCFSAVSKNRQNVPVVVIVTTQRRAGSLCCSCHCHGCTRMSRKSMNAFFTAAACGGGGTELTFSVKNKSDVNNKAEESALPGRWRLSSEGPSWHRQRRRRDQTQLLQWRQPPRSRVWTFSCIRTFIPHGRGSHVTALARSPSGRSINRWESTDYISCVLA